MFDDGVEDGDELSHESNDDDFRFFAGVEKTLTEGREYGIVLTCDEGSHISDISDGLPSAEDAPLSFEGAAFAVEGSDTEE